MGAGMRRLSAALAMLLMLAGVGARAQFLGKPQPDSFRNTSMLRPPAGSKVAIIVFEDLGCPMCARAHPIERQVAEANHVPLVRYDFPIPAHIWTFEGAVCARYIEDKLVGQLADQFRSAVFQSQALIASKDDVERFMRQWLQQHGQKPPFVMRPGRVAGEAGAGGLQPGDEAGAGADADDRGGDTDQLPGGVRDACAARSAAAWAGFEGGARGDKGGGSVGGAWGAKEEMRGALRYGGGCASPSATLKVEMTTICRV